VARAHHTLCHAYSMLDSSQRVGPGDKQVTQSGLSMQHDNTNAKFAVFKPTLANQWRVFYYF